MRIKQVVDAASTVFKHLSNIGVPNLRLVSPNCVSGATLEMNPIALRAIKKKGVQTIIDFRQEASPAFAHTCKDMGFKYILFPLDHTTTGFSQAVNKVECTKVISDEYIAKLHEFINAVNEENVYMGCRYGIDRTNLGLVLNYLLNPKAAVPKIYTWGNIRKKTVINRTLKVARKIIKRMTPEQKKQFNLEDNYSEVFQMKINKLLAINLQT